MPRAVALNHDVLREPPAYEALAREAPAEANDLPTEEYRIARERDARVELGNRAVEYDRFLGQPFQQRTGRDREAQALPRGPACGAIPFRGAGRDELRARVFAERDLQREPIAADETGRRVDDDALANGVSLGVERLLNDERSAMRALPEHGPAAPTRIRQRQLRVPSGRVGSKARRGSDIVHGRECSAAPRSRLLHWNGATRPKRVPRIVYRAQRLSEAVSASARA